MTTTTMTTMMTTTMMMMGLINVSCVDEATLPIMFNKPWPTLKQPIYAVALLAVAYSTVAVVGVISNGLVIGVIYRQPRMRTVTNYFLANLATADILVCVFVLPITLMQNIYTGKCSIIYLSVCLSVRLSDYLTICLSVCLSVCLAIYLSI